MNLSLNKRIMARIYVAFLIKKVFSPAGIRFVFSLVAIEEIIRRVSLSDVFQNSPELTNVGANADFWSNAVMNTELPVQLSLIALALVGLIYVANKIRTTTNFGVARTSVMN